MFDALLTNWSSCTERSGALMGHIFSDGKQRFTDGKLIHTTEIKSFEHVPFLGTIAHTASGARYLLK